MLETSDSGMWLRYNRALLDEGGIVLSLYP